MLYFLSRAFIIKIFFIIFGNTIDSINAINKFNRGGLTLELKNRLNEVPIANLKKDELEEIKRLEEKLGEKYYIIAFENRDK